MTSEGVFPTLLVCGALWGVVAVVVLAFLVARVKRLQQEVEDLKRDQATRFSDLTELLIQMAERAEGQRQSLRVLEGHVLGRDRGVSMGVAAPPPREEGFLGQRYRGVPAAAVEGFEERMQQRGLVSRPTAWERISADDDDGV